MQSTGFAKFTATIIRKDWKQHGKMPLSLVCGMILAILVMMRLAPDVAFGCLIPLIVVWSALNLKMAPARRRE